MGKMKDKIENKPRKSRAYIAANVDPELRSAIRRIAKSERRSLSAQIEIFLTQGVQHLRQAA